MKNKPIDAVQPVSDKGFVFSDANESDPPIGGSLADYNNPSAEDGILVSVVN